MTLVPCMPFKGRGDALCGEEFPVLVKGSPSWMDQHAKDATVTEEAAGGTQ
jgi:hypothetical protein